MACTRARSRARAPLLSALLCALLATTHHCQEAPNQSDDGAAGRHQSPQSTSPIIVEANDESYLILNDDEVVKNPEILRHLSMADKEEVEEIVENSPALQETLLSRIREAVEEREAYSKWAPGSGAAGRWQDTQSEIMGHGKQPDEAALDADHGGGAGQKTGGQKLGLLGEKLKQKVPKIFRIGATLKAKLARDAAPPAGKVQPARQAASGLRLSQAVAKLPPTKAPSASSWPHFRYKISTN